MIGDKIAPSDSSCLRQTQTVTFQTDAVNQISMSGSPTLDINTAVAGSAPTRVTSSTNTTITKLNASSLGLTYQLDATVAAGVVTSSTRLVTFTITGGV